MFRYSKKILFVLALAIAIIAAPAGARAAEEPADVEINFVDVEISSLVRIMSELTGKNFIYDETLRGKITIIAPMRLSPSEAFDLFVSALQLKNYTLVPAGKAFKIVPSAQAKQGPTQVVQESERAEFMEAFIVRLIPLEYISTQEAFPIVQPLVSRFGQISVFGSKNALLVVDTAINVEKILQIISSVDTRPDVDEPEVVYLKHSQAETVEQILKTEARRSGIIPAGKGAAPADDGITADARLNAIVLSGPLAAREYLKRFIGVLDVPPPEASSRINVYYLENAEATELAKVLESLVKNTGLPGQPGTPQRPGTEKISITPDSSTNALIILASPADYQGIVQVIEKLDRRPKQVFVEAMITEVRIDRALDFGVKWRVTGMKDDKPVAIGGVGTVDQSAIQNIISGMAGLSVGGIGNYITVPVTAADGSTFNLTAPGFAALFSLSQFKDVVNVLSTPHILTSDNSEAEIIVGENVPFLSKIERETTSANQPVLQSIERKDVGIKLQIKPKISEGDFVKLDIYQEISAVSPTTTAGASDLITTKRSAKTSVVVKNNQTVIIGGLIQTTETDNVTKIPLLGDIPILGWLFKFKSDNVQRTNLLVFITPHIIDDFQGLEDLRDMKKREFEDELSSRGSSPGPSPAAYTFKRGPEDAAGGRLPAKVELRPVSYTVTTAADGSLPVIAASPPGPAPGPAPATAKSEPKGASTAMLRTPEPFKTKPQPVVIRDVRTGIHRDFDRLVIETTGKADFSLAKSRNLLSIRLTGVRLDDDVGPGLSTRFIKVHGATVDETAAEASINVELVDGTRIKQSVRPDPYRIVLDVYREK